MCRLEWIKPPHYRVFLFFLFFSSWLPWNAIKEGNLMEKWGCWASGPVSYYPSDRSEWVTPLRAHKRSGQGWAVLENGPIWRMVAIGVTGSQCGFIPVWPPRRRRHSLSQYRQSFHFMVLILQPTEEHVETPLFCFKHSDKYMCPDNQ